MSEQTRLMARLTGALANRDVAAPLADRLIGALVVTLDVDGGAVTIGYSAPDRITLCATDAVATRVEELQDLWRQGPSLDAFRTGEPVVLDLQAQGVRWPLLAQGMTEQYAP